MKNRYILIPMIIIIITNFGIVHTIFKTFVDEGLFKYSNASGSFTFVEFKLHDTAMRNRRFMDFKKQSNRDTTLYRVFSKNPLAFWRWSDYVRDDRYKLPYRSLSKINGIRGGAPENKTTYQDF